MLERKLRKTTLIFNSEKKHSVRYDEVKGPEDTVLSSAYINKGALGPAPYPKAITITVEW